MTVDKQRKTFKSQQYHIQVNTARLHADSPNKSKLFFNYDLTQINFIKKFLINITHNCIQTFLDHAISIVSPTMQNIGGAAAYPADHMDLHPCTWEYQMDFRINKNKCKLRSQRLNKFQPSWSRDRVSIIWSFLITSNIWRVFWLDWFIKCLIKKLKINNKSTLRIPSKSRKPAS